jgi:Gametolysin peptidase M11
MLVSRLGVCAANVAARGERAGSTRWLATCAALKAARIRLGAVVLMIVATSASVAVADTPIQGTLFERHGDTLQGTMVDRAFFIETSHGPVRLADPQPAALIGQPVRVIDTSVKPGIQGPARAMHPEQHLALAPAPGPQTVLVLILTTPDDPEPVTTNIEEAREEVFTAPTSAGSYYAQQSNGATTLVGRVNPAGDVLGPIALTTPIAGCPTEAIAKEADERATGMGYTPTAYDHVIYVLPASSECKFGGVGDLPGHLVWSNGTLSARTLAHELGHNMGAHHANLLSCTDSLGAPTAYSSTCSSSEYGDPFDVMGDSGALMSAFHRHQIGQLPEGQVTKLHQSATTTIVSSEDFVTPGARLVLVPIKQPHVPLSGYFAIDTRTPLEPFDPWSFGEPVTTGLTIRKVSEQEFPTLQTQLINTHPTEPVSASALQPGQVFSDPPDGITITAGVDPFGRLQATVSMPTFIDDVPPSAPSWLSLSFDSAGVHLRWAPATDDVAVDHYRVLRNATEAGTTTGLAFDDPIVPTATVTYSVITVDTSGNESSAISGTLVFPTYVVPPREEGEALGVRFSSRRAIGVGTRLALDRRGRVRVRIHCQATQGVCAGIVRLSVRSHGHVIALGSARYNVRADTTANVPVTFAKKLAYLARRGQLSVHVTATVNGGPSVSATAHLVAGKPKRTH